ncbi:MAG: hypothetical protein IT368_18960 [Candidatus Hydrogenedentes bacterium]|nr:hypothetical protein [Candidatus Hydrogenedentota bacterium]
MQRSRKPTPAKGAPRVYILEVNGAKRAASRNEFAFAWQDRVAPDDPSISQPMTITIKGVRYTARLQDGVLRWVPSPETGRGEEAPKGKR